MPGQVADQQASPDVPDLARVVRTASDDEAAASDHRRADVDANDGRGYHERVHGLSGRGCGVGGWVAAVGTRTEGAGLEHTHRRVRPRRDQQRTIVGAHQVIDGRAVTLRDGEGRGGDFCLSRQGKGRGVF